MGFETIERDRIREELESVVQALAVHPSPKSYLLEELSILDLLKMSDAADVDMLLSFVKPKPQVPDALPAGW